MTIPQSNLRSHLSPKAIKTINGKLVVREEVGIEGVKNQLQDIAQKFESFEQNISTLQAQQHQETVDHLKTTHSAFEQAQKVYRRLLITSLVVTVGCGALLFWMIISRSECSDSLSKNARVTQLSETNTQL